MVTKKTPSLAPKKTIDSSTASWQTLADTYRLVSSYDLLNEQVNRPVYSTMSLGLDCAIGVIDKLTKRGGIPGPSIVEVFGPNGTGKSMLLEHMILSVQRRGKIAVVYYSEEPNIDRMKNLGIDMSRLVIIPGYRPGENSADAYAETCLMKLVNFGKFDDVGLLGIDSLKGMVASLHVIKKATRTTKEDQREMDDAAVAAAAKILDAFFYHAKIHVKNAIIFMVNQISESSALRHVGGFKKHEPGEEYRLKTPVGRRKEFECWVRIMTDSDPIFDEEHEMLKYRPQIGLSIRYTVIKNKYSKFTGNRQVRSTYYFKDSSFDTVSEILTYGAYLGIVDRRGNYFYFTIKGKERGFNGMGAASTFLRKKPKLQEKLIKQITARSNELFSRKSTEKLKAKHALKLADQRREDVKSMRDERAKSKDKPVKTSIDSEDLTENADMEAA